jgi:hypothetical protein
MPLAPPAIVAHKSHRRYHSCHWPLQQSLHTSHRRCHSCHWPIQCSLHRDDTRVTDSLQIVGTCANVWLCSAVPRRVCSWLCSAVPWRVCSEHHCCPSSQIAPTLGHALAHFYSRLVTMMSSSSCPTLTRFLLPSCSAALGHSSACSVERTLVPVGVGRSSSRPAWRALGRLSLELRVRFSLASCSRPVQRLLTALLASA